jgi:signal peptidase
MARSRGSVWSVAGWLLLAVCLGAVLFIGLRAPYALYAVRTGSMTPTITPRSAVLVHEGDSHVGQTVSFRHDGGVITHRLVDTKDDGTVVTKGDANETPDPFIVHRSDIIGGVVAAPPALGYWLVFLKDPAGAGSLVLGLVAIRLLWSSAGQAGRQESGPSQAGRRGAVDGPVPSEPAHQHALAVGEGR